MLNERALQSLKYSSNPRADNLFSISNAKAKFSLKKCNHSLW